MKAMTKEEKIKEAWGKLMPDYTNIDLNSGWSLNDFHEDYYNEDEFNTQQIYTPCKIRPKSLQGIENNNGWKSINENLPKEKGYYIMYNGENMVLIELNDTTNMITLREQFLKDGFTHYQPIEKPKPPMY